MNNHMQSHSAFSITEITVTIGIISLLAYIAVSAYPKYKARSQITAAMRVLESYSTAAQNYYTENGVMPSSLSQIGGAYIPTSNDAISGINLPPGNYSANSISITATFVATTQATLALRNNTLTLQLTINNAASSYTNGVFSLICSAPSIPNDYLPTSCQPIGTQQ